MPIKTSEPLLKVKIYITLKNGVLDPQGKAIQNSLFALGHNNVQEVRVGKMIEIKINGLSKEKAEIKLKEMCEKLLANTIIEDYRFEIDSDAVK